VTQIYIISGTSWTVPSDWSNTNTIETIGGGGGGSGASNGQLAAGGGGGGYSKITNLAGLSGTVTIQVGGGGPGFQHGRHTRHGRRRYLVQRLDARRIFGWFQGRSRWRARQRWRWNRWQRRRAGRQYRRRRYDEKQGRQRRFEPWRQSCDWCWRRRRRRPQR
jgi:hypothetical protein